MIPSHIIKKFNSLLNKAKSSKIQEPTAVTLSTVGANGCPSSRMVLLKEAGEEGFVFFTNTLSRKGKQLKSNPHVAMCFHWQPLERQVNIEGRVKQVSDQEADAYWITRPRNSQIGAWASLQSQKMEGMRSLLKRAAHFKIKFLGKDVPRPSHWTGFRLVPNRIEFWKAGLFRLHQRELHVKSSGRWKSSQLYP